jgi:hypothetical protein
MPEDYAIKNGSRNSDRNGVFLIRLLIAIAFMTLFTF